MEIEFHKNFLKNYRKRVLKNRKLDIKAEERINLFKNNPKNSLLRDHSLTGNMKEYRAFWITGNIRIVYKKIGNKIMLYDIGSHPQVY